MPPVLAHNPVAPVTNPQSWRRSALAPYATHPDSYVQPTVYGKHLPRNVGGVLREQEFHHLGHLIRLTKTPHRNLGKHLLPMLVRHALQHIRGDIAWRYSVDGDTVCCYFFGQSFGKPDDTGLGSGIVRLPGEPCLATHRSNIDHTSAFLSHESIHRRTREIDRPIQIGVDHGAPIVLL